MWNRYAAIEEKVKKLEGTKTVQNDILSRLIYIEGKVRDLEASARKFELFQSGGGKS